MTPPDTIASNARIADALDNLEELLAEKRAYLNGLGSSLDELGTVRQIESNLNDLRQGLVDSARFNGHSWTEVGDALNISRQAAQQRYGS